MTTRFISLTGALLLMLCLTGNFAFAQMPTIASTPVPEAKLDKATTKEMKKKMRGMSPADFKKLLDDRDALARENAQMLQDNAAMKAKFATDQEELAKLKASLDAATAPAPNTEDASKQAYEARHQEVSKGIVYKVQIGYFRNKDLSKYFENNPNFSGDVDSDGAKKYTLGYFADYWEADTFKKYLREMGVHDAWTVAYKDGQRVPLRDVLEGASGVGMN